MPWQFNLADGRTVSYPDDMPYEEALQRARRENNPSRVNPDNGWRDAGDSLESGIYALESGVGGLLNMVQGAIPGMWGSVEQQRAMGNRSVGDMIQSNAQENMDNALASMSPEMASRIASRPDDGILGAIGITNDDSGIHFDPAKIVHGGLQSVPSLVATMGVGGGASAGARALGAGETAAARAGQIGAAGTEGALGAGGVDTAIDQSIRVYAQDNPEEFINSEIGRRALIETDGDFSRAVEVAAQRSKGLIPSTVGVVEGIVGYFGVNPFTHNASSAASHSLANSILNPSTSGLIRFLASAGIGGAQEAGEEAIQSGAEQFGTNLGVSNVNPQQDLMAGVPEASLQGAATAFPLGAGFEGYRAATERRPVNPTIEGGVRTHGARTTDTSSAEDAEFNDLRMLPPPDRSLGSPSGPPPTEPTPGTGGAEARPPQEEAVAQAEQYAQRAEQDSPELAATEEDDATRAETIRGMASDLGRAVPEAPEVPPGATRTAEAVPLYGLGVRFGENEDALAHQIYKSAVGNGLSPAETETFKAYSELSEGLYPDPSHDGQAPSGFGIRIVDRLPSGAENVHVVATPASSLDEAASLAQAQTRGEVANETPAAPAPNITVAEPAAPADVAEPAPREAAVELPKKKRRVTARDFTDGLLTGEVRGASISDGRFETLLGTQGHAAETGTDGARYAQLAKSGDVEITSSPPTKSRPGTINVRVTPFSKPENVKQAIAVFQRAAKDGITPSVGLHTAEKPHGVIINDHASALKTLRDIAQGNLSVAATREAPVDLKQSNEGVTPSPATPADNDVIPLAVPGKVIPNVPTNIGRIYQDGGYDALKNSLGKANVMQIRSAAKRFGIQLQPKSSRDSIIGQLANHFERSTRFTPKPGTRLRPGRGLPKAGVESAVRQEAPVEKAPSQTRELAPERKAQLAESAAKPAPRKPKPVEREQTNRNSSTRSLPELKDELRRLNSLDEDAYEAARQNSPFSRDEIATLEGAIQAGDKEAWNMRDVVSDMKRKPRAAPQQEKAKQEQKAEVKKQTAEQRRKARDMTDSYLASSIAKGQASLAMAEKAARDYVQMQRARGKVAEAAWTMAREEALVSKVARYFPGDAGKESFTPPRKGTGKDAPLDPRWVREMQDALKAAAECAASSIAASVPAAAVAEIVAGTGLGAAAAAPIAISGASLYRAMNTPPSHGTPLRALVDPEGYVDPLPAIESGYANNPMTGHPLFAPPDSAPDIPVDNSEVGDRLIAALNLPPRRDRRGPPE